MKSQVNIRVSQSTRSKLDDLATLHGSLTEAVAVATDRLHQEEIMNTRLSSDHTRHIGQLREMAADTWNGHMCAQRPEPEAPLTDDELDWLMENAFDPEEEGLDDWDMAFLRRELARRGSS